MQHSMPLTLAALTAALLIYVWAGLRVGRARGKYDIKAPAVTGHLVFERAFRAQQNTVEQMVLFIPLLGLASFLWGDLWAGVYGAIWCVGRIIFIETYISAAEKRSIGFLLSGVLSIGVLVAIVVTFALRHFGIG